MKKIFLITVFCAVACIANAQITTNEQAYGLQMQKEGISLQNIPIRKVVKAVTDEHKARIAAEDVINDEKPGPVRYAFAVPANYTPENSGSWQTLEDGSRLWRLKVEMPGALSTNAYYDKFWLPDSAKFFVYSEETGQCVGAITSEFLGGSKEKPIAFATELVFGENVVFEYYQPVYVKTPAVISISRIDYGYRYVDNPYAAKLRVFEQSLSCQVNVNCSTAWSAEKHAVTRISCNFPNGSLWCSGALINTTNNSLIPYVLTADHCLNGLSAANNDDISQWAFYWEYEYPGCTNSTTAPTSPSTIGASIKANRDVSDFALLLLSQNPRNHPNITAYYLGWDRSGNSGASGVGIHHPKGDVKKISTTNTQIPIENHPNSSYWRNHEDHVVSFTPADSHWKVMFSSGTAEDGSSGSPLINSNKKVIGQLHGGSDATCDNRTTIPKFYGKFSVSWDGTLPGQSTPSLPNKSKLQPFLGQSGTNPQTVNGIWEPPVIASISGPSSHPNGQYADFQAILSQYSAPPINASSYQWILSPMNGNNVYGANTAYFTVAFYNAGMYQVVCKAQSTGGWSEYCVKNLQVYNPGSYSIAYPNPAVSTLNISFNPEQIELAKTSLQSSSTGASKIPLKTFSLDIKLYDMNGTLHKRATSNGDLVTLDVSTLKNGVYVLHVSDGIAAKPEVHKIVVAH